MLARLFVIVGGLLVLVLLAALAMPPFIDWTGYRAGFEREASAILGRKVTVRGDARARLLPFPSVTFTDVAVSGGAAGQPSMTVDTFSMDAELAPFLRGEVLIFDMRLERPRAVIGVGEDGKVDWAVRPSSPFDAAQIAIEKLTITDGEVELQHGIGGRTYSLTNINAAVSAKSLLGPWRVDGSMLFDGEYSDISASTGRVAEDGQMRVRLRIRPDSYAATVESDGNASIEKGVLTYAGQFRLAEDIQGPLELRDGEGEAVSVRPAKVAPGYRASGKFRFDHQRLVLDEFRFETGPPDNPYAADGTAFLDLGQEPRFRIEAAGAQVQFDEAVSGERGPVLSAGERIAALEKALRRLPRPTIPGSVDVKLPAVVAGDTTIRDVHLSAEPVENGWLVHSLGATLPGRTTLEADGLLATGDASGFRGKMLLAVAQPSGFAAWLAKDVDEAVRRLPGAGFSAEVDLAATRQRFSNLELMLGSAKFTGRAEAVQEGDARPSATLVLDGGALDLEGLSAFASIFVSSEGVNRFAGQDLDLEIRAGPVSAWGLSADRVDTALRLRDGVLEVDRLALSELAGASVSATGRISNFPESPAGRLDASLVAVDLAPLVDALESQYATNAVVAGLARRVHAWPGLLEDARIDAVMSVVAGDGSDSGFAISAHGSAGGSAFSASLSGQSNGDDMLRAPLSATLGISNDDGTALMALAGLPALPLGLAGPAVADISARGNLSDGMETHALLTGDDFRASFEGTVSSGDGAAVKGKASLEAADIEPWLMTAGVALPGMGTGTALSLAADADYDGGLLILNGLSGTVNESAVSGDINVEVKEGGPHISGELALDELDLDPMAAMVMGDPAFGSVAEGWPTAPFPAASAAPFSAELTVSAAALLAGHFATAYDASLALKLDGEGLRVSDLRGKLFGGGLSGLFELKNSAGTGLLNAQMSLSGADLTALLPEAGLSGRADISTSVSTTGKSVDAMVTSLSGSGTASLKDLHIASLNEDALPAFLIAGDAAGRDIDARRTAEFAPGIAAGGSFAAQNADIAFTIANGVVRAPPVKLAGKAADISADLTADLASGNVHVQGAIAYRPGEDALVGSEPTLNFAIDGPVSDMQRSFDTTPLAQYLTQRALEHEQQRVEAMQAELLEKQRLRREARYYADLQAQRERAAEEERRRQEEARLKAEEEARVKADAERAAREERERLRREEELRTRASPAIERAPLPPPGNDNSRDPPATEPFILQNLLKSLEDG